MIRLRNNSAWRLIGKLTLIVALIASVGHVTGSSALAETEKSTPNLHEICAKGEHFLYWALLSRGVNAETLEVLGIPIGPSLRPNSGGDGNKGGNAETTWKVEKGEK